MVLYKRSDSFCPFIGLRLMTGVDRKRAHPPLTCPGEVERLRYLPKGGRIGGSRKAKLTGTAAAGSGRRVASALGLGLEAARAADQRDEVDVGRAAADDVAEQIEVRAGETGPSVTKASILVEASTSRGDVRRLLAPDSRRQLDPGGIDRGLGGADLGHDQRVVAERGVRRGQRGERARGAADERRTRFEARRR